ncbi:MAG: VanZ family protein [Proteobacteria bacterium]|nr:VanZ family protein [Pseudomonadota bacterium]
MRAILLLIAVLICYGSLYPFNFTANGHWLRQGLTLFTQPDLHMGRGDMVGNVLLFAPYGLVAALINTGSARRTTAPLVLRLGLGLLLALALQLAQLWLPSRVPALNDVIANTAGILLGVAAGWLARGLGPAGAGQAASVALQRALAPAVLMLLWLGYQWFPLVPTLDLQNMINAVKPLVRAPQLDGVRALHTALAWLAFFRLWQLTTARHTPPLALAAAALCILGAKLVIVGASISLTNLLGLGLALACLPWSQHRAALPVLIMAMLASLLASGLAPFNWSSVPQAFHWIPFTGMLEGSMGVNLLNLVEKSYFYGAVTVLMAASGARPLAAAMAVAICLAAIEAAQVFLPGRVAETTDPLLALILGYVIGLLSARGKSAGAPARK